MFRSFAILTLSVFFIASCENNSNQRILGGHLAERKEIPYIASLRRAGNPLTHIAGGALISDRWVLTSASALVGVTAPANINVVLGLIDSQSAITLPGHHILVLALHRHENFNTPYLGSNDIALVHLAAFAACAGAHHGHISPIFLPTIREADPIDVVMSGWGATSQNIGPGSRFLRVLRTRTLHNQDCHNFYANSNVNIVITFDMICTDNAANFGFCSTDIGGPLVSANGLIGIASRNVPCGQGSPDVYTRISSYREWIRNVANV